MISLELVLTDKVNEYFEELLDTVPDLAGITAFCELLIYYIVLYINSFEIRIYDI